MTYKIDAKEFTGGGSIIPKPEPKPTPIPEPEPQPEPAKESFKNCTELRKVYPSGVGSDHPAYEKKHDGDNDGWACEPPKKKAS